MKHFLVLEIAVLLICVGLSGCEEQMEKDDANGEQSQNHEEEPIDRTMGIQGTLYVQF